MKFRWLSEKNVVLTTWEFLYIVWIWSHLHKCLNKENSTQKAMAAGLPRWHRWQSSSSCPQRPPARPASKLRWSRSTKFTDQNLVNRAIWNTKRSQFVETLLIGGKNDEHSKSDDAPPEKNDQRRATIAPLVAMPFLGPSSFTRATAVAFSAPTATNTIAENMVIKPNSPACSTMGFSIDGLMNEVPTYWRIFGTVVFSV